MSLVESISNNQFIYSSSRLVGLFQQTIIKLNIHKKVAESQYNISVTIFKTMFLLYSATKFHQQFVYLCLQFLS